MQQIYDIYNVERKTNRLTTAPYGTVVKDASKTATARQKSLE